MFFSLFEIPRDRRRLRVRERERRKREKNNDERSRNYARMRRSKTVGFFVVSNTLCMRNNRMVVVKGEEGEGEEKKSKESR